MRIRIPITKSMLEYASEAAEVTAVNRTVTSPYDTVAGLLGELIFAEYVYQDFKKHNLYDTKGKSDFFNEIVFHTPTPKNTVNTTNAIMGYISIPSIDTK